MYIPGNKFCSARRRSDDRRLVGAGPGGMQGRRQKSRLLVFSLSQTRAFRPDLAPIAIAALAAVIIVSALDIAPIAVAAIVAVGAILLFRCIDPLEAWSSIDGDVLILIFAMLAVGLGDRKSVG